MSKPTLPLLPLVLSQVPEGLRRALDQEGIPTCSFKTGQAKGKFVLYDSNQHRAPEIGRRQVLIDVHQLRSSALIDPFQILLDETSATGQWQVGNLQLREQVAAVNKREVRQRILARLRSLLEAQGGIWLRVAAFPFPYRTAVNFRIDYDDYHPEDFRNTLESIRGFERATSHYVSGANYDLHPTALRLLQGLDVGSHGYWHHTYRDREDNLVNLRRGIDALTAAGLSASGFVAPHGRYGPALREALQALGITHSSEFALAYDELPFFPKNSNVLQIPIHPVCLGLFFETDAVRQGHLTRRAVVERATEYFCQVADAAYRSGEPVFLYGHPTGRLGRYPHLLRTVLTHLSSFSAAWPVTMTRFARWWRERAKVQLSVFRDGGQYVIVVDQPATAHRVAVEFCRGAHVASMPLDHLVVRFVPEALCFLPRKETSGFQPVRIDQPHTLKDRVRAMLDWERTTPTDQIVGRTWRHQVKRTLRWLIDHNDPRTADPEQA